MKKRITALLTTFLLLQSPLSAGAKELPAMTISPDNIVKIEVTDRNGNIMEDVIVNLHDAAGALVCTMQNGYDCTIAEGSPIRAYSPYSKFNCPISWDLFTSLAQPNTLEEVRRMFTSNSYITYTEGEPMTQPFGTTQTYELHGEAPYTAADIGLLPGQIAFYADPEWDQKPVGFCMECQRGTIHVNENPDANATVLDAYVENGILYTFSEYTSHDSPLLHVSFPDGSGFLGSYHTEPLASKEMTEYDLLRLHMQDIFDEANANGTITVDDRTYDLRNDTTERSAMLLLQSDGVTTAAIPDAEGFVECYVSRADHTVYGEIILDYTDGVSSGCKNVTGFAFCGYADTITITTAAIPDDGMYLTYVPAGTYTLTYEDIPEGYSAPETAEITITDSQEIECIRLVLGGGILYCDVDQNDSINAADAALLLKAASAIGSGGTSGLTADQETAADVNQDGTYNAVDAALILQYAAYIGSGGTLTLKAFLAERTIS